MPRPDLGSESGIAIWNGIGGAKSLCALSPNSSHLSALVMLNQAKKDNEAFYLDATDFIYSPRDLQLFVFEFEAPTLSVQGSSYTDGEKLLGRKN